MRSLFRILLSSCSEAVLLTVKSKLRTLQKKLNLIDRTAPFWVDACALHECIIADTRVNERLHQWSAVSFPTAHERPHANVT